jgi:multiple sugar transport system ATP-binding protein
MTVFDNLAFGLRRRNFRAAEVRRRVGDAAETLGLTPYLARKPFALSGGQRQRVALGRAIVRDPKVFLFDEPLSNLDAALRVGMRGELIKLHRRLGATMIYVTHDQVEAMTMGDRICIMEGGRVVQTGAPLDVYRAPVDTFVAGFLGSPPTNLLAAHFDAERLVIGDSAVSFPRDGAPEHVVFGIRPEDVTIGGEATNARGEVLAVGDRFEARDHAQRRGLAASRRPEKDHELAVRDVEVHGIDGKRIRGREALRQASQRHLGHYFTAPAVMPWISFSEKNA